MRPANEPEHEWVDRLAPWSFSEARDNATTFLGRQRSDQARDLRQHIGDTRIMLEVRAIDSTKNHLTTLNAGANKVLTQRLV